MNESKNNQTPKCPMLLVMTVAVKLEASQTNPKEQISKIDSFLIGEKYGLVSMNRCHAFCFPESDKRKNNSEQP